MTRRDCVDWILHATSGMRRYKEIAYAILRVTVGAMFFFYGVGKFLRGVGEFRAGIVERFAESPLPEVLVSPFATVLPFVEVALGALLIAGLFTRVTLAATGLLMLVLTFGAVMEPDPATVASNVNYALVVFVLLAFSEFDYYSADRLRGGRA